MCQSSADKLKLTNLLTAGYNFWSETIKILKKYASISLKRNDNTLALQYWKPRIIY